MTLRQEYMRPSLHFSCTSSVGILVRSAFTACQFSPGMREKKQTSYKVLMWLIVLMFALQTIDMICNWYITWLGFIYYGNAPDQGLDTLEEDGARLLLRAVNSMEALLVALRLAIADSIMVSISWLLPANMANSLHLEGLEVLDHMQQQLEGSNHPSGLQSWFYRYVTARGDK